MAKVIGIDLGTTNSCVAVMEGGEPVVIPNAEGSRTTPSVVAFQKDGTRVVGQVAKNQAVANPDKTVISIKRKMGSDYKVKIDDKAYSPQEISAMILSKLKADAEAYLGSKVTDAVITCPAYFTDAQRQATKDAGKIAGLNVLRIINEPTAAALSYGLDKEKENSKVMIYDLGGGTFDCTVMKLAFHGGERQMQVITTGGNHQLGGKDWDAALANLVRQKFCDSTGADITEMEGDAESVAWFSENIEKAKKNLTNRETTSLTVNFDGKKERVEITRAEFEDATSDLLEQTIFLVNDMLEKKGMNMMSDIDEIILVGGSTYMPQVSARLTAEYGKVISSYEPNKAVAMGAALVAHDCTEVEASPAPVPGGQTEEHSVGGISLTNPMTGSTTVVIENCTKSYGLRIISAGQPKVLNLVIKDTPKPAHGSSIDHFPLTITGDPAPVSEVNILILENDSLEEMVELSDCNEIYVEEPIQFEGAVPGDNQVSVDLDVDANGIVSLSLTDQVTGKVYHMSPKRKSDEANQEGMSSAGGMTLR